MIKCIPLPVIVRTYAARYLHLVQLLVRPISFPLANAVRFLAQLKLLLPTLGTRHPVRSMSESGYSPEEYFLLARLAVQETTMYRVNGKWRCEWPANQGPVEG